MYPERLLPSNDKKNDLLTKFNDNCYLCHWTKDKDILDEQGNLKPECVELKRIFGLSNNLIGENSNNIICSEIDDVYLKITDKKFEEKWDGNDDTVPKPHEINYEVIESRGYFFIKVGEINQIEGIFPRGFEKDPTSNEVIKKIYKFTANVEQDIRITNLCHFEIKIYEDGNKEIKSKKGSWGNIVAHGVRSSLIDIASFDISLK